MCKEIFCNSWFEEEGVPYPLVHKAAKFYIFYIFIYLFRVFSYVAVVATLIVTI